MIKEEKDLVHEIYAEGNRKYAKKLEALAEVLGDECDSERMAKKICDDIWKELVRLSHIKEYDQVMRNHGISVYDDWLGDEAKTGINVKNAGCEISHLPAYCNEIAGSSIEIMTFDSPHEPLGFDRTATEAASHVRRLLNLISLWTVVALRFKEIKKEIEAIETRMSGKRVCTAKKVLDIIRKM